MESPGQILRLRRSGMEIPRRVDAARNIGKLATSSFQGGWGGGEGLNPQDLAVEEFKRKQ